MVQEPTTSPTPPKSAQHGQALIEYALILTLVVMALVAAVAATGPALGNVFSNTVFNLVGITGTPQDLYNRGGPVAFWLTVTYVATNPPAARSFPTGLPPAPTASNTPGPSPTPSATVPTATPTATNTLPPTPTATDAGFNVPYVDSIDNPVWWRVDSSMYLGGYDWLGQYYPNTTLSGQPDRTFYNQQLDPAYRFNVNFNWGTTSPLDNWNPTSGYSIRFTRTVTVTGGPFVLNFTLDRAGGARFIVDGATVIDYWTSGSTSSGSPKSALPQSLSNGTHTLIVEYFYNGSPSSGASLTLGISANKSNVKADVNKSGGAVSCPWSQITGTQPNTLSYAWKENLPTVNNGFPQNMTCNLELRGYVDLSGVANPTMSFWDVWDLGTASDTSIKLQLAQYAPYNDDLSGGPSWGTGVSYNLHSSNANYAWTRNEFVIPPALQNKKVTWRFVIDSGGQSSVRRWYLDDIRLDAGQTAKTFGVCTANKYTCGDFWDLDNTNQTADFITSGRWSLTNKTSASNDFGTASMSWDIATNGTNGSYAQFGSEQGTNNRVHYVAFNGWIDFSTSGIQTDGSGGTPDWEGDYGLPILSFYQAYSLAAGESIQVEYTRDTDAPGSPSVWTRVGTSAIQTATTTTLTDVMKKYELQLNQIPNWNTQKFRLRFALYVNYDNKVSTGWYIDNIAIERAGLLKYSDYPFCDDAEDDTSKWLMGGQWGIATTSGAFQTGNSFSDSPLGNYVNGQVSSMTLRYPLDLNNDTPENIQNWGGNRSCQNGAVTGPSTHPVLTFWTWRKLASSKTFRIDLFRQSHGSGPTATAAIPVTSVWSYTYNSTNSNQTVWEREELDLRAAVEKATGLPWATLMANTDKYDDDFFLQFTFDASSGSGVSDGIYIDNVAIKEYSETSYKLWPTNRTYTAIANAPTGGTGTGTDWLDNIDNPSDWYNRWTTGSTWTSVNWDSHSGNNSLHDSGTSGQKYLNNSFNVLEMNRILDLRGTNNTDLPTMYFWTHYNISSSDAIAVEVAVQDDLEYTTGIRNTMGYDYQYQWGSSTSYMGGANSSWNGGGSSWQLVWDRGLTGSSKGLAARNDAWTRQQVDLRNFVGKRIKVRFVLNSLNNSGTSLGWWLDDVEFAFRTSNVFTVGFLDSAQNMRNWVAEGTWGLAPDQWRGSGGGAADLGSNAWSIYWIDCINWMKNPNQSKPPAQFTSSLLTQTSCSSSDWDTFFNNYLTPRTPPGTDAWLDPRTASNMLVSGIQFVKDFKPTINYDFGTDGRPSTADNTWYDYYGARFMRNITVSGGQYTFITTSDDGVRVRVETPTGATPNGVSPSYWNVINNWNGHSRTVDYQLITLDPGNYQIIMEYYENTGSAVAELQVGTNKFSFSDSPKAGAGTTFPVVKSIPYSESSLILNGVLNLNTPAGYTAAQWKPRLDYYMLYFFDSNTYGSTEVTTDGGFTWTQAGLSDTTTCPSNLTTSQCDPNTWGYSNWTPANGRDWVERSHSLANYVNQSIGVRFKLHTDSSTQDGWWLTDISLGNAGS